MKRPGKALFYGVTVFLLLLIAASLFTWIQSYCLQIDIDRNFAHGGDQYNAIFRSNRGHIYFSLGHGHGTISSPPPGYQFSPGGYDPSFYIPGATYVEPINDYQIESNYAGLIFSLILLLIIWLNVSQWVAWLVARATSKFKLKPGICRHCGYDLRATPDRCPECGTPALVKAE